MNETNSQSEEIKEPVSGGKSDVYRIHTKDNREIVLVGTAHISQVSKDLVHETIEAESPDTVCVELDDGRLKSIQDPDRWKNTDLRDVIKKKQLATLIANLVLGSYQKRMGAQTGVKPGSELKEAVDVANSKNIPLVLADRQKYSTGSRRPRHQDNAPTHLGLHPVVPQVQPSRRAFCKHLRQN